MMNYSLLTTTKCLWQVCEQHAGEGLRGHDQCEEEGGRGGRPDPGKQQHPPPSI